MVGYAKEYVKNDIMTADGVGVVILLYDGIIKFSNMAKNAIKEDDPAERSANINKAIAIVAELTNALDMERGEKIAENLFRLYAYMLDELVAANVSKDPKHLDIVIGLVSDIKEGWEGIKNNQVEDVEEREHAPLSVSM